MVDRPEPHLWVIFFGDTRQGHWWCRLLRPGFRHVAAAAWFVRQERWVIVDPVAGGTVVEVLRAEEANGWIGQLFAGASAVVRFESGHARAMQPATGFCVAQIKALLGVRCRALTPYGLYRHLIAHGAEIVDAPKSGIVNEQPVQIAAAASVGRPVRHCGT